MHNFNQSNSLKTSKGKLSHYQPICSLPTKNTLPLPRLEKNAEVVTAHSFMVFLGLSG